MRAARLGLTVLLVLLLPCMGWAGEARAQAAGDRPDAVRFTYLGTGGWLLEHEGASILTAPFFSNPGLVEVGVARLEVDTAAVARNLPPVEGVSAILVGHAHYDHLMDVPFIARTRAPRARIYGSHTTRNLLLGDPTLDPARLEAVEDSAVGTPDRVGRWFHTPDRRFRFMALASDHAPHLMGIRLYHGTADRPRDRLPERAHEWLDGPTLAWLIDVLDPSGKVLLRVHYQDAAASPPRGFPPRELLPPDGIPVDVVILCPAGSGEAAGYPEGLLEALRPRVAFLGHWEDFFRPMDAPLRPVPGTDIDAFERRVHRLLGPQARVERPDPGDTLAVTPRQRPSSSRP